MSTVPPAVPPAAAKPRTSNISDFRQLKLDVTEAVSDMNALWAGLRECKDMLDKSDQNVRDFQMGLRTASRLLKSAARILYALPRIDLPER